ncbi:hypothetical protein LTR17_023775 [Elasticomyces elasticus]|nr:hypothetical protein LTR17_023775 [Elasticomyces elasticus]
MTPPAAWPWPTHHKSNEAFEWIKATIKICQDTHDGPQCRGTSEAVLPTRVIDVGLDGTPLRVVTTHGTKAPFIALSHCWGGDPGMKLTTASMATFSQQTKLSAMPQTFQDAVHVTRQLNIQYIWIDALEIIQDDAEDWAKEAATMAEIYSNAHLVLCASLAEGDSEGFLRPLSDRGPCLMLSSDPVTWTPDTYVQVRESDPYLDSGFATPLDTRAWCFQESLLARRIVSYEKSGLRYYCGIHAYGLHDIYGDQDLDEEDSAQYRMPYLLIEDGPLKSKDWNNIADYGHITFLGPAVHSPSFAWSSVNEEIDVKSAGDYYDAPENQSMVKILEADCFVKGPDPYGHVSWGVLRLLGSRYTAEL